MARNLSEALVNVLGDVMLAGEEVTARGQTQREVRGHVQTITQPTERVLILPGRANNVFAQIAETAWVLAGRDDLDYLSRYLTRAVEFSDDGRTWRAAYGPRLRRWGGHVDQLNAVVHRFAEDPNTKRAVMSIFDPAGDYGDTKDVPCNNWLHFLQRDNLMHLSVAVRANDAIWGFSGINFFEWSVLQELIANSAGSERVGELNWFVGSMHVYQRHYAVAEKILRNSCPRSPYDFGVPTLPLRADISTMDEQLAGLMELERQSRLGNYPEAVARLQDPFLAGCASMLQVYNMLLNGSDRKQIVAAIAALPPSDLRVAAVEYLSRKWGSLFTYELPLTTQEWSFLEHHFMSAGRLRVTTHEAELAGQV